MATQKAISLKGRRKVEEGSGAIPFSAERERGIQVDQAKATFGSKTFKELSMKEKDQLLRAVAISLGLIRE